MSYVHRRAIPVFVLATLWGSVLSAVGTESSERETALQARNAAPTAVVAPFQVDPEMREWVHREVGYGGSREKRLNRLLMALLGDRNLDLTYAAGYTGTAREVFETRSANCLGFTHLFVGLARELGVSVDYLRVADVQRVQRQGDFVVVSGHVSAGYNTGPEYQVLDFSELPSDEYRHVQVMDDRSVVALHHVNRGAELMLEGRWSEALKWLELGVTFDPTLPEGWVNLGVHYRQAGRIVEAEQAYRTAIELSPEFASAYQNLAALLMQQHGRRDEALGLLDLATENKTRNPYHFVALGDLARGQGRMEIAGSYYRRALALAPGEAETLAAMGIWADLAEKPRKARKLLRKAKSADAEHPRVKTLAQRLRDS